MHAATNGRPSLNPDAIPQQVIPWWLDGTQEPAYAVAMALNSGTRVEFTLTATLFGTGNPSGASSPAYVQGTAAGGAASLAFTSSVTAGNLLVVAVGCEGVVDPLTVADSVGTTYAKIAAITGENNNLAVYAGIAGGSGANTVIVTGLGSSEKRIAVAEFTNTQAVADVLTTAYNGSSTATLSVTTAETNDVLFCAVRGYHDGNTFSFTGAALISQSNGGDANAIAYALGAAPGAVSINCSITAQGADNSPMILIAFKAVSATPVSGNQGDTYYDTSISPFTQYVYYSGAWNKVA